MSVSDDTGLHIRIRAIQSQIRIAVQNHQILFERLHAWPHDTEAENLLRIIQELIISMGRTQLELMYQFKQEIREKHPKGDQKNILMARLGWPDRYELKRKLSGKPSGGPSVDSEKRYQILKKKQMLPARPGAKMQSLLKVNNSNGNPSSILTPRKESERLKAAAATKLADLLANASKPAKSLNAALKLKSDKATKPDASLPRRSSVSDDKSAIAGKPSKDPPLAGTEKKLTEFTSIGDLSQDNYLQYFGLIHKDKSKNIVVNQGKRKRRSAAGQSNFYNDYFQPKKPCNKKSPTPSIVPESPCSSQDIIDLDEYEEKPAVVSPPLTEKKSVSPSPEDVKPEDELEPTPEHFANLLSPDSVSVSESKPSEMVVEEEDEARLVIDDDFEPLSDPPVNIKPGMGDDASTANKLSGSNSKCVKSSDVSGAKAIEDAQANSAIVKTTDEKVEPISVGEHSIVDSEESVKVESTTHEESIAIKNEENVEADAAVIDSEAITIKDDETKLITDDVESNAVPAEATFTTVAADSIDEVISVDDQPLTPEGENSATATQLESTPQGEDPHSIQSNDISFPPTEQSMTDDAQLLIEAQKSDDVCVICFEGNAPGTLEKCYQCSEFFHKECNTSSTSACPLCYSFPPSISTIVGVSSASSTLTTSSECSEVVKRYLGEDKEHLEPGKVDPEKLDSSTVEEDNS